MNIFEQIHQTATMRTETFDELRIIGQDALSLPAADRRRIAQAAEELETAYKLLVKIQCELIESNQARIATTEQLIEARRQIVALAYFSPLVWHVKWNFNLPVPSP